MAVYELHESQKVFVGQFIWYLNINKIFDIYFYVFSRRPSPPLHIRDITNSAYICIKPYNAVKLAFYIPDVLQKFVTENEMLVCNV